MNARIGYNSKGPPPERSELLINLCNRHMTVEIPAFTEKNHKNWIAEAIDLI